MVPPPGPVVGWKKSATASGGQERTVQDSTMTVEDDERRIFPSRDERHPERAYSFARAGSMRSRARVQCVGARGFNAFALRGFNAFMRAGIAPASSMRCRRRGSMRSLQVRERLHDS